MKEPVTDGMLRPKWSVRSINTNYVSDTS